MENYIYEKEYEVRSYDTNANGKLSPHSLFNYLQDIAGRHATKLNFGHTQLEEQNRFWVLSRIICKLKSMPLWEDKLTIQTWPVGVDGVFAIRNFRIYKHKNIIGEASSSWIIVDATTRRPVRPNSILPNNVENNPVDNFTCPLASKLTEKVDSKSASSLKKVNYSDLDINNHVNNAQYLRWLIDTYPPDFLNKHEALEIEVNYLSETSNSQEYRVLTNNESNSFNHSIVIESSGKTSCKMRILWNNC